MSADWCFAYPQFPQLCCLCCWLDVPGFVDRLVVPGQSLSDHAREVINCLLPGFVLLPQACLLLACQLLALWGPWSPFDVSAVTAVSMAGWLRAWACKASKSLNVRGSQCLRRTVEVTRLPTACHPRQKEVQIPDRVGLVS